MAGREAPRGNQNTRRNGFYSRHLDEAGKLEYQAARDAEGLDHELAVLRVKLHRLTMDYPDRLDLLLAALRAIARLVRVKYDTQPRGKNAQGKSVHRMMVEEGRSLGMKIVKVPANGTADPLWSILGSGSWHSPPEATESDKND